MEKLATALAHSETITADMLVPLPPPLQRDILVQRIQPLVVKHCPRHAATILAYMYSESIGTLLSFANLQVSDAATHLRHWQTSYSQHLSLATLQASRLDTLTAKPSQRAAAPSTAPCVTLAWQDPARSRGSADDRMDVGRQTTQPTANLATIGCLAAMDVDAQGTGANPSRQARCRELLTPVDMHALLTDTGKVSLTRVDSPGVVLLSYRSAECQFPEIPEANIGDFLAAHSSWTAFKPAQELGGLLPTDDLLLEQPRKAACPGCRRTVFLGHVTCPSCGQAMSKDVAAPATIERVSRDAGSRVATSRREALPSTPDTHSPGGQSDVFRNVVTLATTEANAVKRLNAKAKRGRRLPSSLRRSDFPLQGIADRYFKDSVYREGLRRMRKHRQTKFPLAGFSDDPLDDTIWRQLTGHLPASSPYLTWTGGSEVEFLDFLAHTHASLDNVEVVGVRMSRRDALSVLREDRSDSSSTPPPTPRRKRSRRRHPSHQPSVQATGTFTPPRNTADDSAASTGQDHRATSTWHDWQGSWWSGEWHQ